MKNNTNLLNKNNDISVSKRHKISAALYLVTNHVHDSDPYKMWLRQYAVALLAPDAPIAVLADQCATALQFATLAKLISLENATIIIREFTQLVRLQHGGSPMVEQLFAPDVSESYTDNVHTKMSLKDNSIRQSIEKINQNIDQKNKRQDHILSFINNRKSAVIKDISSLFPEVSEKTIQRELGALVDAGKISKRGSKRWSIYLAISS